MVDLPKSKLDIVLKANEALICQWRPTVLRILLQDFTMTTQG